MHARIIRFEIPGAGNHALGFIEGRAGKGDPEQQAHVVRVVSFEGFELKVGFLFVSGSRQGDSLAENGEIYWVHACFYQL